MRIALTLSYQGTQYCGWQVQAGTHSGDKHSVQFTIQEALQQILQSKTNLIASGRTDSGVHAVGQVAHFDVDKNWDVSKIQKGLNSILPKDIRVLEAREVSTQFHSQKSAIKKQYSYYFLQGPSDLPVFTDYSVWIRRKLEVEKMQQAAKLLLGERDFKAFQASRSSVKTTIREILESHVTVQPVGWPQLEGFYFVRYQVVGTGFLKQMVRAIAGTLLNIGEKKKEPEVMTKILESKDRSLLGATAPARGLFLERVWYPET